MRTMGTMLIMMIMMTTMPIFISGRVNVADDGHDDDDDDDEDNDDYHVFYTLCSKLIGGRTTAS
eukprot:11835697-Karenia_brevis.AAC.1